MNIELTTEQNDLVRRAIEAGRIARPEQAVAEAMAFWVEAERQRGELLASLDQAEAEFERGEYITIETEDDARALVADIMAHCRTGLAAKDHAPG